MGKYQELGTCAENTMKMFGILKERCVNEFVNKLCSIWACEQDSIGANFKSPSYFEGNKMITWDFSLTIQFHFETQIINFTEYDFQLLALKDPENDPEMVSPIIIRYKERTYKLDDDLDGLSDAIFQNLKKVIAKGSWY